MHLCSFIRKRRRIKTDNKRGMGRKKIIVMPFLKKAIDKVAVRAKILNKTPLKKHKKIYKTYTYRMG